MRAYLLLLPSLMLAGCATRIDYQPSAINNAQAIVERVLYEQPDKRRPESVHVTERYVEFGRGATAVSTPGMNSVTTTSIRKGTRLYYRSIAETLLFGKRSWFVVEPRSSGGRTLAQIYVEDEANAKRLMDALATLKEHAPDGE
ncbi:Lipoprotein [Cupriavidus sp. H19C3]